jgi:adenylate cyclase
MISESTRRALTPGAFRYRLLDVIRVKGKTMAIRAYEVYAKTAETLPDKDIRYYEIYDKAMEAYLLKDFSRAKELFGEAVALRPGDRAVQMLLERIDGLDAEQLPEDWDGSVSLNKK